MATSLTIIGRLTKDIEIKKTKKGKEYGLIKIAVRRDYKDSNGKYITDFFIIPLWGKKAISVRKHSRKGSLVAVYGKLETNKDIQDNLDKNYINIVASSVEYLSSPKQNQEKGQQDSVKNTEHEEVITDQISNEIPNIDFSEGPDQNTWY